MNKKERLQVAREKQDIYSGILFNNKEFQNDCDREIIYTFDCPEYKELIEKYELDKIAKKGTNFRRAKRLLHYLAPRLKHSSWYDNHIECNALKLLEYSFNKPEQGINCLNKAKIFQECCMALGIHARRVCIMPQSPYDMDNHVVCEIYDKRMKKWIMMDPSSDCIFVDENKTPLSLLEMREKFANNEFITIALSNSSLKTLDKYKDKYADDNAYICKNLFYFTIEAESKFGEAEEFYTVAPKGYCIKNTRIQNVKYRIKNTPLEYESFIPRFEEELKKLEEYIEPNKVNVEIMKKSPIRKIR